MILSVTRWCGILMVLPVIPLPLLSGSPVFISATAHHEFSPSHHCILPTSPEEIQIRLGCKSNLYNFGSEYWYWWIYIFHILCYKLVSPSTFTFLNYLWKKIGQPMKYSLPTEVILFVGLCCRLELGVAIGARSICMRGWLLIVALSAFLVVLLDSEFCVELYLPVDAKLWRLQNCLLWTEWICTVLYGLGIFHGRLQFCARVLPYPANACYSLKKRASVPGAVDVHRWSLARNRVVVWE